MTEKASKVILVGIWTQYIIQLKLAGHFIRFTIDIFYAPHLIFTWRAIIQPEICNAISDIM